MWQQWINTILGLWIVALPFIGIQSSSAFTWTLAVTGIIVAILAAWGAGASGDIHRALSDVVEDFF